MHPPFPALAPQALLSQEKRLCTRPMKGTQPLGEQRLPCGIAAPLPQLTAPLSSPKQHIPFSGFD